MGGAAEGHGVGGMRPGEPEAPVGLIVSVFERTSIAGNVTESL